MVDLRRFGGNHFFNFHLRFLPERPISRTLKVRGGIISQVNRYLGGFCSSQRIFPPQIIQVLLHSHGTINNHPLAAIGFANLD